MNLKMTVILIVIVLPNILSCVRYQTIYINNNDPYPLSENQEPLNEKPEPSRAERVLNALLKAYPDKVEKVEFRNNDWAILLRDTWFYFAEGRLLPEDKRENAENYRPYQFYNYPAELPSWQNPTPEEIERFQTWRSRRSQSQTRRSSYFIDTLYQASTRAETERQLVRITFLGRSIRVHKLVQRQFALVEQRILAAAEDDPHVSSWIRNMGRMYGWNWRNIADTQTRSYHSYGLAIDILPRSLGNLQTYWLWTLQHREDWWNVSYNERYHPPAAVIKIFEANGFIWGGKWPLYDTMHFEYRPEVLILNGLYKSEN